MLASALQIRRELIDLARHYNGPAGFAANHESHAGADSNGRANVDVADLSHEPNTLAQWCELHEQIGSLPDLEREAFLSLCGEAKTLERIGYTLKTGKTLRN